MGTELQQGNLYVRSEDGSWNRLCAIIDMSTDGISDLAKELCSPASMLDRAKEVIKQYISFAMCGIFDTRNWAGDDMATIYDEDGLTVDICYDWEYFEVFGLSMSEFQQLEEFYETLRKEVRAKEKEIEMKMANCYEVLATRKILCNDGFTEFIVKAEIIRDQRAISKSYEVKYSLEYNAFSYHSFYDGLPSAGEIRSDLAKFYRCHDCNVRSVKLLIDEALGIVRSDNLNKSLARQLINSRYGLATADIRECFGDSTFNKIYNNLDISREMRFAYTGKWPMIECKTTAKEQYRNREKLPEISEVIFNKPATIVKWADGTKTVVKAQGKERYNKEKGLAMAIAKKAMGNSNYYYTIIERYLEDKK